MERQTYLPRRDFLKVLSLATAEKSLMRAGFFFESEDRPKLSQLKERLDNEIKKYPIFETAISVVNLQNGESMDVNGDLIRHPGCAINLLVLVSVLRDVQKGLYSPNEVVKDIAYTIRVSSAARARKLLIKTGSGSVWEGLAKVNRLIDELGLKKTNFDHPPAYWETESLTGKDNTTTANEMAKVLTALWNNQLLEYKYTAFLLEKMTKVSPFNPGLNYLIPAGIPKNECVSVGHKNGFFWDTTGWVDNDIGIVWRHCQSSYAYTITMFFQQVPKKYQWRYNLGLAWNLTSLTWEHFERMYHTPQ